MFSYIVFFFFLNIWWVNSSASFLKKKKLFQNQVFTIILKIAIAIIEFETVVMTPATANANKSKLSYAQCVNSVIYQ